MACPNGLYAEVLMIFCRRSFAHRLTAMLLAFAMPLCCCIVNGLTGGGCCSDNAAPAQVCMEDTQVPACCMSAESFSEQQTQDEYPAPCDKSSSCTCCLKVTGPVFEWTVPVDSIGTLMVDLTIESAPIATEATTVFARSSGFGEPPPPWQGIAAGCGHTILHC